MIEDVLKAGEAPSMATVAAIAARALEPWEAQSLRTAPDAIVHVLDQGSAREETGWQSAQSIEVVAVSALHGPRCRNRPPPAARPATNPGPNVTGRAIPPARRSPPWRLGRIVSSQC